jgi:hypothetical protein
MSSHITVNLDWPEVLQRARRPTDGVRGQDSWPPPGSHPRTRCQGQLLRGYLPATIEPFRDLRYAKSLPDCDVLRPTPDKRHYRNVGNHPLRLKATFRKSDLSFRICVCVFRRTE